MNQARCFTIAVLAILAQTSPASAQFGSLAKSVGTLGARIFLKDPIDTKCTDAGLKSCPDVTEGLLLYVDGKPEDGEGHLRTAALANSPEQLQTFAQAISAIGDIPGAAKYMGPLLDAARFLVASSGSASGTADRSPHRAKPTPSSGGSPASSSSSSDLDSDENRLLSGMAMPLENSASMHCGAGGIAAICVRVGSGPMIFTGMYEVGQCAERAIALSGDPNGDLGAPRWAVTVSSSQPVLNGAQMLVPAGQALFVGLPKTKGTTQHCSISWSGKRLPGAPLPDPAAAPVPTTAAGDMSSGRTRVSGSGGERVSLSSIPAQPDPVPSNGTTSAGSSNTSDSSRRAVAIAGELPPQVIVQVPADNPGKRFVDTPEGWLDTGTRLVWQKRWSAEKLGADEASNLCGGLQPGHWRLPSANEVQGLSEAQEQLGRSLSDVTIWWNPDPGQPLEGNRGWIIQPSSGKRSLVDKARQASRALRARCWAITNAIEAALDEE